MINGKSTNRRLELEIEEQIIKDKTRYGRVRNSMMRNLRTKYGSKAADRALWRVNKELERNVFQKKRSTMETKHNFILNHQESSEKLMKIIN